MENILKPKGMLCNVKRDTKANIQYSALEWKVTVFSAIHFPATSYPVFVFVQNNHGCLSVMQSLQYKTLGKAVLQDRDRKSRTKKRLDHYNMCKE